MEVLNFAIGLAIAIAGGRCRDQLVDPPNERVALEAAVGRAKAVAGLKVSHRLIVITEVIMRLPQCEVERLSVAGRRFQGV